jgi:excisionase family DNA binding protein
MSSQLHTVGEVAELLRVSPRTIHNLVTRGELVPTRIGDRLLFHAHEIDRFAKEGVKALAKRLRTIPVNRAELDAYTASVDGPFRFVLESLAAKLDGVPFNKELTQFHAIKLAGPLLQSIDEKIANRQEKTQSERLAVKYLGMALLNFSEDGLAA